MIKTIFTCFKITPFAARAKQVLLALLLGIGVLPALAQTTPCGTGTAGNPFTSLDCLQGYATGTYCFSIGGNTFQGYVDGSTDGGGWVEILNYVHQGGTNPALNVRTTTLPVQTSAALGTNESASATAWGHAAPALVTASTRWKCASTARPRPRPRHPFQNLAGRGAELPENRHRQHDRPGRQLHGPAWPHGLLAGRHEQLLHQPGHRAATEFPFYSQLALTTGASRGWAAAGRPTTTPTTKASVPCTGCLCGVI